jgi:integrase
MATRSRRFTYVNSVSSLLKKGKNGDAVTDPTVPGLQYIKQGSAVYARLRVTKNKKREHVEYGRMPSLGELLDRGEAEGKAAYVLAEQVLDEVRAWARAERDRIKLGISEPAPMAAPEGRTLTELWREYGKVAEPKLRPKTFRGYRALAKRIVLPNLGHRPVAAVTRHEVETLHASLAATPYQANRARSLLSAMFNKAVSRGWRPDNPVKGVAAFEEQSRDKWLTRPELERLLAALNASPHQRSANAAKLLMLVPSRKGEVLNAKWSQFDLEAGTWTKPSHHTKQRRLHHVPLNPVAVTLLKDMKTTAKPKPDDHLFPGNVPGKPLTDIKRFWKTTKKALGFEGVRMHDLRHSLASVMVSEGEGLHIVGALLGHTQARTTQRYAHLSNAALREAAERFSKGFEPAADKAAGG